MHGREKLHLLARTLKLMGEDLGGCPGTSPNSRPYVEEATPDLLKELAHGEDIPT